MLNNSNKSSIETRFLKEKPSFLKKMRNFRKNEKIKKKAKKSKS